MTAKEYKDLTMNSAAVRWFCNTIEMPLAHLIGKGDVRIYGRDDIRERVKMQDFTWSPLRNVASAACTAL